MSMWTQETKPLPNDFIRVWRSLYFEEGWTLAEIAAEHGCSPEAVGHHLSRFSTLRRPRAPNIARYKRMVEAAASAPPRSGPTLAARFGLTPGSWRVALHHARKHLARLPER